MLSRAAPFLIRGGATTVDDDKDPRGKTRIHRSLWSATENQYIEEWEARGNPIEVKFQNPRADITFNFCGDTNIEGNVFIDGLLQLPGGPVLPGGGGSAAINEVVRRNPANGAPAPASGSFTQASSFPQTLPMVTAGPLVSGLTTFVTLPSATNAVIGTNASPARIYEVSMTFQLVLNADATYAGEKITPCVQLSHNNDATLYEWKESYDIPSGANDLVYGSVTGKFEMTTIDTVTCRITFPTAPAMFAGSIIVTDWSVVDLLES